MSEKIVIDFYFDIASPYSYIAAARIEDFAREVGCTTRWVPVLLGGIFRATGNEMPARIQAKAQWMSKDLRMMSQMAGVPFRFPKIFPMNTVSHLRALIAAEKQGGQDALKRLAMEFYKLYWGQGRDISAEEWFAAASAGAGLSAEAMSAANDDAEVKAQLIHNTEEAVERGAFGAPTFVIDDRLFWGNDRFEMMRWYLEHVRTES